MDIQAALKKGKKNSLTREQAMELYNDLRKNVNAIRAKKFQDGELSKPKAKAAPVSRPAARPPQSNPIEEPRSPTAVHVRSSGGAGSGMALFCVLFFAALKMTFAILEYSGVASVPKAEASMAAAAQRSTSTAAQIIAQDGASSGFSKEQMSILTSLDARRAELEEREKKLEEKGNELDKRDREFAARQTQLKEMTDMLRGDREKNEKKKSGQLDQLANVYGSMDPKEASVLIEQLDVTIALSLLQRMPEKRIGQILAMMNPQRALALTKMLSGKTE